MSDTHNQNRSFMAGAGIWLPLTLAAGLIVRLIGWLSLRGALFAGHPSFNDLLLRERSTTLLMGQVPEQSVPWGSPVYPYFTALIQSLFGESSTAVFAIQALAGLATAVLLAWALAPVLATRTRWIAALLYAVNPIGVWLEMRWQPVALAMLLLVLALRFLFFRPRRPTITAAAAGGLTLGAGFLLQPLLFLAVAAAAVWRCLRRPAAWSAGSVLMIMFIILPLLLCAHNRSVPEGQFTWNRSGAFEFYRSLESDTWGTPRSVTPPAWADPTSADAIAHGETGQPMTDAEVTQFFLTSALSRLAQEPIRFFGFVLRKTALLLTGHETPDPVSPTFVLSRFAPALRWGLWLFPPLLVLALLGGWISGKNKQLAIFLPPLIAIAAVNLLGLYSSASRWPLVLAMLPLAAIGITEIKRLVPTKSDLPRYLLPVLLVIAVASYLDLPRVGAKLDNKSEDLRYASALVREKLDAALALQYARDAIAADETNAAAHADLAKLLITEDLIEAAQQEYEAALAIDPINQAALFGISELLRSQNMHQEAERYAGTLVMQHPHNPLYLNQLAAILMLQNRFAEAKMFLRKALELMPEYEVARINLLEVEKIEATAAQLAFPPELSPQPGTPMMDYNTALMTAQQNQDTVALDSLSLYGLEQFPDAPFAHYMRGFCLFILGRYEEALAPLQHAADEVPGRFILTQTTVRTLLSLERIDEALVLLQKNVDQAATEANRARLTRLKEAIEEQLRLREAQNR